MQIYKKLVFSFLTLASPPSVGAAGPLNKIDIPLKDQSPKLDLNVKYPEIKIKMIMIMIIHAINNLIAF